ncbi:NAD-dependent succinate-semialdehyde dehydrogenase [Thalassotalea atypica]|uniref:NAD-dependent succinate-semialdehyde dehydrogenase n=1 Tax=Thalassotalea atypica TaxID=2054316 RepID=UPI0025729514|nr:NAD-dependent succinate-semialdehyde dehydrogenase [Thalassotalea atypica]
MLNLSQIKTSSYINGEWKKSSKTFSVVNPLNDEIIASISDANIADAIQAIEGAKSALKGWSNFSVNQRAKILKRWFELICQNNEKLAQILTLEQGKPIQEARGEINYGASYIEWFAEEGKRIYGDVIAPPSLDKRIIVIKQPVGVVTAITPWNFPNAMIARKAAAALAAGCTFVVRPASLTPLSALALAELAEQAGIPAGVFNVVVSSNSRGVGEVLTTHADVDKFTFTGSTEVGKSLIKQCASGVKKVSMELGGNAPFIIFEDADIDAAVQGAITSKFRNAGQTCVCTNRILVQESVLEEFTTKFVEAVNVLKIGDGMNESTDIGPMISNSAVNFVNELVQQSIKQGATALSGAKLTQGSTFYPATVLAGVTNDMPIAVNEIFGPVAPILSFKTEEEAIALANDTEYGLAAYFYSRDIGRVWRVSEGLDFGMVGINEGIISNAAAPFGGMKQSGNGREGSKYGLDDYLDIKYLCMGGM